MNYQKWLILALGTLCFYPLQAQEYCLQFKVVRNTNTMDVTIGLVAKKAAFYLGTSNLQFRYPTQALGTPILLGSTLSNTSKYNTLHLTAPTPRDIATRGEKIASFNLNFTGRTSEGMLIPLSGTDLATLRFPVLDATAAVQFEPYVYEQAATVIYNDNVEHPMLLPLSPVCTTYRVGLEQPQTESTSLKVYPNLLSPTQSFLNVEWSGSQKTYQILDGLGRLVQTGELTPQLIIKNLESGHYVIRVGAAQAQFVYMD
jgi:hypothetical protein